MAGKLTNTGVLIMVFVLVASTIQPSLQYPVEEEARVEEEQVDSSKQGRTDTSHDDNSKHSRDSDNSNSDEEKIVESTGENTQKARSQSDSTKNVKEDGPGPSIVGSVDKVLKDVSNFDQS